MAEHHVLMLNELRSDLAEAGRELERLNARCGQIRAAISLLEEKIQAGAQVPTEQAETQANIEPVASIEPGTLAMMSMPEAIRQCLRIARRPLAKRELMAMLRDGGKLEGNHFSQGVYNTLQRLSKNGGPVQRESDGRWSMVAPWPLAVDRPVQEEQN